MSFCIVVSRVARRTVLFVGVVFACLAAATRAEAQVVYEVQYTFDGFGFAETETEAYLVAAQYAWGRYQNKMESLEDSGYQVVWTQLVEDAPVGPAEQSFGLVHSDDPEGEYGWAVSWVLTVVVGVECPTWMPPPCDTLPVAPEEESDTVTDPVSLFDPEVLEEFQEYIEEAVENDPGSLGFEALYSWALLMEAFWEEPLTPPQ